LLLDAAQSRARDIVCLPTILMRPSRRGGRKRIVAPDRRELAPATKPQQNGTLIKPLARSWRWQRMLDGGVYASVSDIGDAENIPKSYVSSILRLALLAPDIVEAILAGKADQPLMLGRLVRPLPANWDEQRRRLSTTTPIAGPSGAQPAALSKVMPSKCRPRSRA
jgi:hypothetical protein